jgi:hypothetical protein
MACEKLHRATGHTLKDGFLSPLPEVLAREKTSNSRPKQSTAKHAAAAAWVNCNCDSPLTVLLVKTGFAIHGARETSSKSSSPSWTLLEVGLHQERGVLRGGA